MLSFPEILRLPAIKERGAWFLMLKKFPNINRRCLFTFGMSTEYFMFSKVSDSGTNGSVTLLLSEELQDSFITLFMCNLFVGGSFCCAFRGTDEMVLPDAANKSISSLNIFSHKQVYTIHNANEKTNIHLMFAKAAV